MESKGLLPFQVRNVCDTGRPVPRVVWLCIPWLMTIVKKYYGHSDVLPPASITAKEIHPIDAVIQIHSGIVTVVATGICRQSAIQSRFALLFQYDVDNTAHTIGFILCRRISNYLDTFDRSILERTFANLARMEQCCLVC